MTRKLLAAPLALVLLALSPACDSGGDDHGSSDDAPLSDYDALMEGSPTNDELPFEIKADGPPPRQHDSLLEFQSEVKSQGRRGVCSIFSTVGLMEHLYLAAGMESPDFSEQYLQWSAKFEVGSFPNTSGSNAFYNLRAISNFGIPAEAAWPYEVDQWDDLDDAECVDDDDVEIPTRCYTNGAPPADALNAEKFTLPTGRFLNTRRESIMDHIRVNETGVIVGLDFFYQSWNHRKSELPRNLDSWDAGIVRYPNEEDKEISLENRAGHSIVVVGWDLDMSVPRVDADGNEVLDDNGDVVMETGFYLFKNSWGTEGFGIEHPAGAGYGWLSMDYVEEYGRARVSEIPDFVAPEPEPEPEPGEGETFSSTESIDIPDNTDAGISSNIEVAEEGAVSSVIVRANIEHTWRGDLTVRLVHGDTSVVLHDGEGGGQDDLALEVSVSEFAGADRKGEWTLEVVDSARFDTGTLTDWSITVR